MKLGVFNLWTEMREQKPSAAFEVAPHFFAPANASRAPVAPKATAKARAAQKAAVSKRKPPVIVDEITAS